VRLAIDRGDLLALAQIGDGFVFGTLLHTKHDAAAGTTVIEAEHETRLLARAAVEDGIDAERAMRAFQEAGCLGLEGKARPPHERAVAEHPKLILIFYRHRE